MADPGFGAEENGCLDENRLQQKKAQLIEIIEKYGRLVIAFSGGVDSSFLVATAKEALGDRITAVTAESPVHPLRERKAAAELALALQVDHIVIPSHEMDLPDFVANPGTRCYTCKKHVLELIRNIAAQLSIEHVAHGVNLDDLSDYRPGQQAADELGVIAPLVEAGLTKQDIRRLSKEMDLPTWDKPSMACLASRIPYGQSITSGKLSMVEAAEDFILALGVKTCRVRHHGSVARIEVDPADFERMLTPKCRDMILNRLVEIGFVHVALDLKGYQMGSMNKEIKKQVD